MGALRTDGTPRTGFATSEEKYADEDVGKRIQPFWVEEEARKLPTIIFILNGRFKSPAGRGGNSHRRPAEDSGAAARLMTEALGV